MKQTPRFAAATNTSQTSLGNLRKPVVRFGLVLAVFLLQTLLAGSLWGQEFRGLIIGSVSDPSGAVIPNATITARGPQQTYTSRTNSAGNFSIPFVQPGAYTVTAEAHGFKKESKQEINVDVSQKVNVNFTLDVGSTTEEVVVKGDAVSVNTADASGGTVMDPEKVQNLPVNGREIDIIMSVTSGV